MSEREVCLNCEGPPKFPRLVEGLWCESACKQDWISNHPGQVPAAVEPVRLNGPPVAPVVLEEPAPPAEPEESAGLPEQALELTRLLLARAAELEALLSPPPAPPPEEDRYARRERFWYKFSQAREVFLRIETRLSARERILDTFEALRLLDGAREEALYTGERAALWALTREAGRALAWDAEVLGDMEALEFRSRPRKVKAQGVRPGPSADEPRCEKEEEPLSQS